MVHLQSQSQGNSVSEDPSKASNGLAVNPEADTTDVGDVIAVPDVLPLVTYSTHVIHDKLLLREQSFDLDREVQDEEGGTVNDIFLEEQNKKMVHPSGMYVCMYMHMCFFICMYVCICVYSCIPAWLTSI